MKYVLEVGGVKAILTDTQLECIVNTLVRAERLEEKWIGSGNGTDGQGYIRLLRDLQPMQHLRVACMTDDEYGAVSTLTKLENEKNQ